MTLTALHSSFVTAIPRIPSIEPERVPTMPDIPAILASYLTAAAASIKLKPFVKTIAQQDKNKIVVLWLEKRLNSVAEKCRFRRARPVI